VACIILALDYLNSDGIMHRDLTPENLLIDEEGYLKVCDLALASHWSS
jgi:serine/threonine protein kinase